jgi:hypothetical protein
VHYIDQNLHHLFPQEHHSLCMEMVDSSAALLHGWRGAYLQWQMEPHKLKAKIGRAKLSGTKANKQWGEFDDARLFAKTDFLAQRVSELREVLGLLRHVNVQVRGNKRCQ